MSLGTLGFLQVASDRLFPVIGSITDFETRTMRAVFFIVLIATCQVASRTRFNATQCVKQLQAGELDPMVKADLSCTLEGNLTYTVEGNLSCTVEDNLSCTVAGNLSSTVEGNLSCAVQGKDINGADVAQEVAVAISYTGCRDHCPVASPLNIMSMVLTLGSPTLAGYSLILTTLNGHYVASRFAHFAFPNARDAVRVLAGLQQAPLRITHDHGVLASLVVLPQNDRWWMAMTSLMYPEHTWSISAFANLTWVLLAYMLTVIDSFRGLEEEMQSNGESVGALWLWLFAIVVGWLVVSPKCGATRLRTALTEANESLAHVVTDDGTVAPISSAASKVGALRAMSITTRGSTFLDEEVSSPPIFNYSRFFSWNIYVDQVAEAFRAASSRAENCLPVDTNADWIANEDPRLRIHPENRRGTKQQLIDYCSPPMHIVKESRWGPDVLFRMAVASVMALMLQWATSGAAIMVVLYTPRTGLGCRSGAYILYAIGSTLVWILLVLSSVLGHYSVTAANGYLLTETISLDKRFSGHYPLVVLPISTNKYATTRQRIAGRLSIALNTLGKCVAVMNAIWLMCACIFQFANVFNTCFCNSSVYGHGENSFVVLTFVEMPDTTKDDIQNAWIGAVSMSLVAVGLFVSFIWMYHKHPEPVE